MNDSSGPTASGQSSIPPLRRVIQWFFGTDVPHGVPGPTIAAANVSLPHLHRARLAVELAERALDDVEPLKGGPGAPLAISLLREAAYWALTAQCPENPAKTLLAAFDAADRDLLIAAAGGDDSVEAIRAVLAERTFLETAEIDPKVQDRDARRSRTFVRRLVTSLERRSPRSSRIGRRAAMALAGLVALGVPLVILRPWKPANLAAHKTWRTSTQTPCDLTFGFCSGRFVDLLFHTEEEASPWAELDLGEPTSFRFIQIKNREDCCKDRAVPLVVEASNDGASWKELGRKKEAFDVWNLRFDPENARYLRFSVPRQTMLHLKSVRVE